LKTVFIGAGQGCRAVLELVVQREALAAPGAITAETWLVKVLPSHLGDEIGNLIRR